MTTKTKTARHSCNYNRAFGLSRPLPLVGRSIVTDYERGALIAGVLVALTFGLMFVHAAVVL
jgi:hypothetical protein